MISLNEFTTLLALPLLLLQGVYFAFYHKTRIARLLSLLFFLLASFLLLTLDPALHFPAPVVYLLGRFSIAIPAVIWLISFYLFSDDERVHPGTWALIVGYFLVRSVARLDVFTPYRDNGAIFFSTLAIPQFIMLGFSIHALYLSFRGYFSDLIEIRRTFRVLFVACVSVLVTLVLGNGVYSTLGALLFPDLALSSAVIPGYVVSSYLFVLMLAFSLYSFQLRDGLHSLIGDAATGIHSIAQFNRLKTETADLALMNKLLGAMQMQKPYREAGCTITGLSVQLGVPEHRLRRVINQNLAYRNFNQFLNHYRVDEAAQQLVKTDASVSNIALEVGFASLSAFNKAFKDRYGMTPTTYRLTNFAQLAG